MIVRLGVSGSKVQSVTFAKAAWALCKRCSATQVNMSTM